MNMPDKRKESDSSVMVMDSDHDKNVISNGESEAKKAKVAGDNDSTSTSPISNSSHGYEPIHFIRSHSKNNDPADIQTQIWDVVFEPDPNDSTKTTSNVATCGGNAICIIDVQTGTVLMKYRHKELKETFYTLAWTTLDLNGERSNILVSGGIRGEVRIFHPKHKVCFHDWRPVEKKSIAVNSLVFHSKQPTWLFCGTSEGVISLWDIGVPTLPSYDGVEPVKLLRLYPDYGDVYNIAWTGTESGWLLAGTAAGLVGYHIEEGEVRKIAMSKSASNTSNNNNNNATDDEKAKALNYTPRLHDFIMPENKRDEGENPIVDSLSVVSEWTVVNKCALHGFIYVWDLKATLESATANTKSAATEEEERGSVKEAEVKIVANLKWSDTDNFYMNLGCHKESGYIACGDDKGTIWLYDQSSLITKHSPVVISVKNSSSVTQPHLRLLWPELQDDYLENSRKVALDKQKNNIIVDKVAISHDNVHVVAVTSNNMVCIWKKGTTQSPTPIGSKDGSMDPSSSPNTNASTIAASSATDSSSTTTTTNSKQKKQQNK